MGWTLSDETDWCWVVSKIKDTQEGRDKKNDNFDNDIIEEVAP